MLETTQITPEVEQLANRIAELLDAEALDTAATALTLNLAAVIAGYGYRGRESAEQQITTLLSARVEQLAAAGQLAADYH